MPTWARWCSPAQAAASAPAETCVPWTSEAGPSPCRTGPSAQLRSRAAHHSEHPLWSSVICDLNGVAAGLGATLALFCDVIYASDRARIGDTHVRAGLVAGDGGAVIWPLLVGVAKAKELLMTGDIIEADEAERIGLVNRVVPHDDLIDTVNELAQRLANGPALAIAAPSTPLTRKSGTT